MDVVTGTDTATSPGVESVIAGVRRLTLLADGATDVDAVYRALARELLGHFPTFTDLVFEQALSAQDRGDLEGAAALYMRCLEMGNAPPRFSGVVGRGSFLALGAWWTLLMAQAVVGAYWHTPLDTVGSVLLSVGLVTAGGSFFERKASPSPSLPAERAPVMDLV